jgi:hypothetical protein
LPKKDAAATDHRDYTLAEWLAKRRISRARFTTLQKKGLAPAIVQLAPGGKISITREADEQWARRIERLGHKPNDL